MDVTDAISGVDRALGCVGLRWSTEDEIGRTLNIPESLRGNQLEAGEYYGLVPSNSIVGSLQVVRSNIGIRRFTPHFLGNCIVFTSIISKTLTVQLSLRAMKPMTTKIQCNNLE